MIEEDREHEEGKEEGVGEIKRLPNPGGQMAHAMGCTCPVYDNNQGFYPPYPPDGWWITEGCPVHKPNESKGNGEEPY